MKSLLDHLDTVKAQPHHVRKRVTLLAAGGITSLIGAIWLGSSLATGAFALPNTSFAQSTGYTVPVIAASSTTGGNSQLAGAAAALGDSAAPAHIVIIDTATSAPAAVQSEQTTIPF